MKWKNIINGILMGISDLIPGVSGSTIAIILGIYDNLLQSINKLFSKKWKDSLKFLIPLGIGILITLLFFSKIIKYLLHNYEKPTQFFFLGLIIAILPLLFKTADVKNSFESKHYVTLGLALVFVASMGFITPSNGMNVANLSLSKSAFLFISGWLASMAMLLPGISGSFVLVLLGVYPIAIDALATLNLPIIAIIGLGVIIGFLFSSRAIHYLLSRYYTLTFAAIIGLVIGSLAVIYPGVPIGLSNIISCAITFVSGFIIVTILGKLS